MASIVANTVIDSEKAAVTSLTGLSVPHVAGDLLVAVVVCDVYNADLTTATTGWIRDSINNSASSSNVTVAVFKNYAATGSEPMPVISSTISDQMIVTMLVVDNVHATTQIDATSYVEHGSVTNILTEAVIPTYDNSLVISVLATADRSNKFNHYPPIRQYLTFDDETAIGVAIGSYINLTGTADRQVVNGERRSSHLVELSIIIRDADDEPHPHHATDESGSQPIFEFTSIYTSNAALYVTSLDISNSTASTGNNLVPTLDGVDTLNATGASHLVSAPYRGSPFDIGGWQLKPDSAADYFNPTINGYQLTTALDLSSDNLVSIALFSGLGFENLATAAVGGVHFGVSDGTNYAVWKIEALDSAVKAEDGYFRAVIDITSTPDESSGTLTLTAIDTFIISTMGTKGALRTVFAEPQLIRPMPITGGSANYPASFKTAADYRDSGILRTVEKQRAFTTGQYYSSQPITLKGNVYFNSRGQSLALPAARDVPAKVLHHGHQEGSCDFIIDVSAGATLIFSSTLIDAGEYHTVGFAATSSNPTLSTQYEFEGLVVLSATPTWRDLGFAWADITFSACRQFVRDDANMSGGCTFSRVASGEDSAVLVTSEAVFAKFHNCSFIGNTNAPAILITGNQTGTWVEPSLTVSGNTYDIEYSGATDFTIQSANALVVHNSSSGVLTIATPSLDFTVTSNIADSDIKIFTTTTQTILSQATGTTDAYTYTGTPTFDWTVMKKGYLPQRGVGEVMAGVSTTVNVTLIADSVYNASHGLTYTTNLAYARATSVLTLSTRQDARDIYSALVDGFIDESALDNTAFDFKAIGPDRIDLLAGVTLSDYDNWKGAGFIQYNSSDAIIAKYLSVKSSGTIPGSTRGEIQQVDGSGTVDLRADGTVDQIIQYYRDDNGDGTPDYDYEGHLVIKFQPNGYQESRVNVLTAIGISALEPFEYFISMEPAALTAATGDPAISITVVDHTASPLVVSGKSFDYEIQDNGTNTAEDILKEWNYNKSLDATMHTLDPFNWPDFVVEEGATYATQVGFVEGQNTTTTLHGCYVEQAGGDHPGFTRFQSNDSSYYTVPVPDEALTITSNVAALIQYCDTGVHTVIASTTGTSLVYTYSDTDAIDIIVQAAGYLPQRFVNVTPSDSTFAVVLALAPVYDSGHGLTWSTDFSYNPTTGVLTLAAEQEGRNIYSALIDAFIAQSSLINYPFNFSAIGPDRIDFIDGATIDAGDIQFWKGAGMQWYDAADSVNPTHKFCSIKSVGSNPASTTCYHQQVDGGTPVVLTLNGSDNIDEVMQYWSDPNHDGSAADGYDYSGHLVFKLFKNGYYQQRSDILQAYGLSALEPYEYTVAMTLVSTGLTVGDPSISISITDDTAAPVTVGGKLFDYTIVDGGTNTAENILRQLNYDITLDPTATIYTSYVAFDLSDFVIESGGNYETAEGTVEGQDTTTTTHGMYVSRSSADHPDFTRFQSNDSTYYTPTVTADITITGLVDAGAQADDRLQIANVTALTASIWQASTVYATGSMVLRTAGIGTERVAGLYMRATTGGTSNTLEPTWDTTKGNTSADTNGTGAGNVVWTTYDVLFYDADPAGTGYSTTYTNGEEFNAGDSYEIKFAEMDEGTSFKTSRVTGVTIASGFTVGMEMTVDTVFAALGLDGSAYETTFSPNFGNDRIVMDTNTDFAGTTAFAYFAYTLTTSQGMYDFWGGVTAIDVGNFRINNTILDLYFDESGGFVKQTDSVRIFRADGARPAIDPTSGGEGIEINWRNPVYVQNVGGSALTAGESALLTTINQATDDISGDVQTGMTAQGYAAAIEGSLDHQEVMRLLLAAAAGKLGGADGTTVSIRDQADSKDRIVATVDENGNRTAVTVDAS
tara:strand:+ start:228 stop:5822 length:5595 start_codon:yes stop_codon:yes gene_type:complete